jgi:hypothetical protein
MPTTFSNQEVVALVKPVVRAWTQTLLVGECRGFMEAGRAGRDAHTTGYVRIAGIGYARSGGGLDAMQLPIVTNPLELDLKPRSSLSYRCAIPSP